MDFFQEEKKRKPEGRDGNTISPQKEKVETKTSNNNMRFVEREMPQTKDLTLKKPEEMIETVNRKKEGIQHLPPKIIFWIIYFFLYVISKLNSFLSKKDEKGGQGEKNSVESNSQDNISQVKQPLEPEQSALCSVIQEELKNSKNLEVDCKKIFEAANRNLKYFAIRLRVRIRITYKETGDERVLGGNRGRWINLIYDSQSKSFTVKNQQPVSENQQPVSENQKKDSDNGTQTNNTVQTPVWKEVLSEKDRAKHMKKQNSNEQTEEIVETNDGVYIEEAPQNEESKERDEKAKQSFGEGQNIILGRNMKPSKCHPQGVIANFLLRKQIITEQETDNLILYHQARHTNNEKEFGIKIRGLYYVIFGATHGKDNKEYVVSEDDCKIEGLSGKRITFKKGGIEYSIEETKL